MHSLALVGLVGHVAIPSSPDEFASQSRLCRLDPRAKIASAVVFAVAVSLMTRLLPLALAFVVSLFILALSGLRLRAVHRQMHLVLMLVLMIAFPVYLFRGFDAFVAMVLRVLAATIVLLTMVLTTASADLTNGLRGLGLPKSMVILLAMAYRYLFLYGEEAARMSKAREARGAGHGRGILDRRVLRTVSSTAGLILVKAYMRGSRVSRAMRARGHTGDAPFGRRLSMTARDAALIISLCSFSAILLMLNWGVLH